jgi:zinc protease
MKRLLTTILVLLSLAGQSHAAIEPKLIKSPGGITAWFFNDPNTPVIAINFLFRGGARLDPAGKAGLASITSDLLDSGTMEKDPNQFDGLKQDYAIQMDFTSDADQLGGSLATLVQHKDIAFDLLHEVLTSPRLKEDVFANVMNMARTSLANETNEPNYLAKRKMQTMLFKGHSYENPVDGLPGTIEKITLKDIGTFIKSNLTKDRLVVSITGNLSEADSIAMLDKIFGSLPEKSSIPLDARIKPAINGQHEIIDLKIPQSIIFFVLPGVMYDDPDFMKSALLMHIMGEGFTSRLYREIREKHGLAYAVFANNVWSQEAGYLGGMVGSPKAKASQSILFPKKG